MAGGTGLAGLPRIERQGFGGRGGKADAQHYGKNSATDNPVHRPVAAILGRGRTRTTPDHVNGSPRAAPMPAAPIQSFFDLDERGGLVPRQ
jgi:hypothetical protein